MGIAELWQYRNLFFHFVQRDVKVRYRHAALGFLWAILQPVLLTVVFTLIFKRGFSISDEVFPYPFFAFNGLIIWLLFASGVNGSANSLVRHSTMLNKIYFPRMVLPLAAIATGLFDFMLSWVAMIALAFYFELPIEPLKILLLSVLSLLLAILATLSIGLVLSALNAKYRDFQYVLPFVLQLLFFSSPVFYDHRHFEGESIYNLLKFNPLAGALHVSRTAWTTGLIDWEMVSCSAFTALILAMLGVYIFRKMEAYFGDLA